MSECLIAAYYDYAEPVARKEHKCCECGGIIKKGEKHFHGWGKWDGEFSAYRQHLLCMEACMLIRDKFNGGECISFGTLMEEFWEYRHQWDGELDRHKEPWKRFRSLMAKILWRRRHDH